MRIVVSTALAYKSQTTFHVRRSQMKNLQNYFNVFCGQGSNYKSESNTNLYMQLNTRNVLAYES